MKLQEPTLVMSPPESVLSPELADHPDPFPFDKAGWVPRAVMGFAIFAPLLGVIAAVISLWGQWVTGFHLALFLGFWALTGIGVTLGYHRMLTHKAFEANWPTRMALLITASMSIEGKPSDWAATHIRHHAMSDKEGDPHSPVQGFIHAHFGWMLRNRFVREGPVWNNLRKDWVVRFVDATWVFWVLVSLAAPFFIGLWVTGTWMGALLAFIWGTGVRVFWTHHLTWAVNSVGHLWGTRPHATEDQSHNNLLLALLTWGEGWHNNHHHLPRSPFIGLRWWQVDIGGYVLRLLRALRLVKLWQPRDKHRPAGA